VATPKFFRVSLATREAGQIGAIGTEPSDRPNGRLRDVISATEVYTELNEYLATGVARSGLEPPAVLPHTRTRPPLHRRHAVHAGLENSVSGIFAMALAAPVLF
jgi:hypothetical protein